MKKDGKNMQCNYNSYNSDSGQYWGKTPIL